VVRAEELAVSRLPALPGGGGWTELDRAGEAAAAAALQALQAREAGVRLRAEALNALETRLYRTRELLGDGAGPRERAALSELASWVDEEGPAAGLSEIEAREAAFDAAVGESVAEVTESIRRAEAHAEARPPSHPILPPESGGPRRAPRADRYDVPVAPRAAAVRLGAAAG
jgi:hypothetical protein